MSFPRTSVLAGLVAGLLALSGLSVSPSSAQDAQRPVVGAVFGDSFASGEGLADVDLGEAECQRALGPNAGNGDPSTAWGVTALEDLPVQRSWFAACTGARSEHFKETPQRTGLWPYPVRRDKTQYAEAVDGTGTERFDVVLASFGGNDLEFAKVIRDCINIEDAIVGAAQGARAGGWAGAAAGGAAGALTGRCQPGLDQDRREAIDRIAKENLPKLYNDLADATAEGALIVVTGYPQLFEDPTTSWLRANALTRRCHGMHFDDADIIRGLAGRLNQAIGAEVKEAAKRHPGRTWVFADVSFPFDGHGLCSDRAKSWINGITTGLMEGDFRYTRSFHPTQEGHTEGYAGFISGFRQVEEWQPRPVEGITRDHLLNMTLPPVHSCSYADEFDAPAKLSNGELYGPGGGGMLLEDVVITDVDGDDVIDGIAKVVCSSGAAGTSTGIFIINGRSGTTSELTYTDDTAIELPDLSVYRVEEMALVDGALILTAYGHGIDDATCCPSYAVTLRYQLGRPGPPRLVESESMVR